MGKISVSGRAADCISGVGGGSNGRCLVNMVYEIDFRFQASTKIKGRCFKTSYSIEGLQSDFGANRGCWILDDGFCICIVESG